MSCHVALEINLLLGSILGCPTVFQMHQALSKASCFQPVCLSSRWYHTESINYCLSLLFFFTPSLSLYFSTDGRFYGNKEWEAGLGLMERCQTARRRSDRVCVCGPEGSWALCSIEAVKLQKKLCCVESVLLQRLPGGFQFYRGVTETAELIGNIWNVSPRLLSE